MSRVVWVLRKKFLFWITHPTIGSWVHYPKEMVKKNSYHFFREINFTKISWNWFHEKRVFPTWCCVRLQKAFSCSLAMAAKSCSLKMRSESSISSLDLGLRDSEAGSVIKLIPPSWSFLWWWWWCLWWCLCCWKRSMNQISFGCWVCYRKKIWRHTLLFSFG